MSVSYYYIIIDYKPFPEATFTHDPKDLSIKAQAGEQCKASRNQEKTIINRSNPISQITDKENHKQASDRLDSQ